MLLNHKYSLSSPIRERERGVGFKPPSPSHLKKTFFALMDFILEVHYCALGTFPKKMVSQCAVKIIIFYDWSQELTCMVCMCMHFYHSLVICCSGKSLNLKTRKKN